MVDNTYEEGDLTDQVDEHLNIIDLEIYGLGGNEELINQTKKRDFENQKILENRKVDKKMLLDDFTKEHLLGSNYKHLKELEGREGIEESDLKR